MPKRDKREKPRERKPTARYRVPAVELDVVPLTAEDAASESCVFCGRVVPLRTVVTIRGGRGDGDILGVLALCEEHAAPAARLLTHAFTLVLGTPSDADEPA